MNAPSRLDPGMKTVLTLAGLVVVIAGLGASGSFLMPVIVALFLAVVSTPVLGWLQRARVPRVLAIVLTVLLDVALLAGLVALVGGSLSGLEEAVPRYELAVQRLIVATVAWSNERGVPVQADELRALGDAAWIIALVGDLFTKLTSFFSDAFLVVLLVIFMLFELEPAKAKLAILLGGPHAHLEKLADASAKIQRYLVVKTLLSTVTGLCFGLWLWIVGVDFPLLWGILAFLLNYIPTIGPTIATVPPVFVALLTLGPGPALAAAINCLVVNVVVGNVFEPRMMGEALGLSTFVVFASMLFWGWLWGPVGALLAVPLTMLMRGLLESSEDTRWLAVMLGSSEWVEAKRLEWGWAKKELP